MTRHDAEQTALELMTAGYNCAETLLRVGIAQCGLDAEGDGTVPLRIATCFGGGVARSHEELCGALSGSIMALSLAYGRDTAAVKPKEGLDLAATFRSRFRERFGASCCRELLERLGPQENWSGCKGLVAEAAGLLYDLVREHRDAARRVA